MLITKNDDPDVFEKHDIENNWVDSGRLYDILDEASEIHSAHLFAKQEEISLKSKPLSEKVEQCWQDWLCAKANVYASILEEKDEFFALVSKAGKERGWKWGMEYAFSSELPFIYIGGFQTYVSYFLYQDELKQLAKIKKGIDPTQTDEIDDMFGDELVEFLAGPEFQEAWISARKTCDPHWIEQDKTGKEIFARKQKLKDAIQDKYYELVYETPIKYNLINYDLLKEHFMFFAKNGHWPKETI
jgi:hypothetical protein